MTTQRKKIYISILVVFVILTGLGVRVYMTHKKSVKVSPAVVVASQPQFSHSLTIADFTMQVAVVDTEASREHGLSDTNKLEANQGMLFVFDSEQIPAFWMKDMRYDLDMIWIGADMSVKDISANATVASYPDTIFRPSTPAKYVLEVPAGFVRQHHVQTGDKVSW